MKTSFEASANPAFFAYVVTCLLLSLNLLMLWVSSGATRAKVGVAINPEDGASVTDLDPPAVARFLRAHNISIPVAGVGLHSRGRTRRGRHSNFRDLRRSPDHTFDCISQRHAALPNHCFCRLSARDHCLDGRRAP